MTDPLNPDRLIRDLAEQVKALALERPLLVGIHSGGVWVAEQLHAAIASPEPLSSLDISFYRDDFSRVGLHPQVRSSSLPVSVADRNIVLIDDVLHTGRTARAALNEIFSYGRPAKVVLCALLERSGRELPIQADLAGRRLHLDASEHIKLTRRRGRLELGLVKTGRAAEAPRSGSRS